MCRVYSHRSQFPRTVVNKKAAKARSRDPATSLSRAIIAKKTERISELRKISQEQVHDDAVDSCRKSPLRQTAAKIMTRVREGRVIRVPLRTNFQVSKSSSNRRARASSGLVTGSARRSSRTGNPSNNSLPRSSSRLAVSV